MTVRIVNGQVVLPPDQQQKLILGRGVAAELRVVQVEAELVEARQRIASLESELAEFREELEGLQNPGSAPAAQDATLPE